MTDAVRARRFVLALAAVAVAAFGLRVVNVTVWRPTCEEDLFAVARSGDVDAFSNPPTDCFAVRGDALYGHLQGRMIADGHGFVDGSMWFFLTITGEAPRYPDSAGDPPLYSMFLGAVSAVGGTDATWHRSASSLVGAAGVVAVGLLGRRVAGPRAGLVAAGLAGAYPMLWINDGMLLSESIYAPLCAVAMLAGYRVAERPTAGRAAWAGAAVGVAALARAEALLAVVAMGVPLAWHASRTVGRARAAAGLALGGAVAAAAVAPWIGYNMARFEEPATMTSGTGAVLSAGLCDATFEGAFLGYYANCFDQYVAEGRVEGWPDRLALDESQRDAVARRGALSYLGDHLDRFPVVVAARIGRMWDVYRPAHNTELNWRVEGRDRAASEAGLAMYAVLAPLSVAGAVVLRRRGEVLAPLLAMVVVVTVTAAITFGVTRYRVPADVALCVLAAVALDAAARRWRPA